MLSSNTIKSIIENNKEKCIGFDFKTMQLSIFDDTSLFPRSIDYKFEDQDVLNILCYLLEHKDSAFAEFARDYNTLKANKDISRINWTD